MSSTAFNPLFNVYNEAVTSADMALNVTKYISQ